MIEEYVCTDAVGNIEKVLCKICGAPIWSMRPYGNPRSRKLPDGKIVETQGYAVRPTEAYADIKIEMAETLGRHTLTHYHVTCLCKNCIPRLTTQDLQALFRIDMKQLGKEGSKQVPRWLRRRAVKIVATGDVLNPVM